MPTGGPENDRKEKDDMRYYETLYLVNPNLADDDYKGVLTKFSDLVEKSGGVPIKVDEWGKKTLAYKIKKFDKGFYVLAQYCGEADITNDLHREFKLDERIIKYQTVKLSDNEDPEALKLALDKGKETVTEGEEKDSSEQNDSGEEVKNGVQ
jgi:small subunit ribosomal protein S6